jgi:hypothetical protein
LVNTFEKGTVDSERLRIGVIAFVEGFKSVLEAEVSNRDVILCIKKTKG